jgi:hypothetical protein
MRYRCEKVFSKRRIARFRNSGQMGKQLTETQNKRMKFGSPKSLIQANNGQNSELVFDSFASKAIFSAEKKLETNAILSLCTRGEIYTAIL